MTNHHFHCFKKITACIWVVFYLSFVTWTCYQNHPRVGRCMTAVSGDFMSRCLVSFQCEEEEEDGGGSNESIKPWRCVSLNLRVPVWPWGSLLLMGLAAALQSFPKKEIKDRHSALNSSCQIAHSCYVCTIWAVIPRSPFVVFPPFLSPRSRFVPGP